MPILAPSLAGEVGPWSVGGYPLQLRTDPAFGAVRVVGENEDDRIGLARDPLYLTKCGSSSNT
jgi:hypothetical protein